MTLPIMVLAVLALVGGFYLSDKLPQFLELPELHYDYSAAALLIANLPAVIGAVLGVLVVKLKLKAPAIFRNISLNAFYIDKTFAFVFGGLVKCLSSVVAFFDRSVLDKTVEGVGAAPTFFGNFAAALQSGQIRFYALMMFAGIVAMLYAFSF
jgi:NADH-quinone oxidoreductase subunit L